MRVFPAALFALLALPSPAAASGAAQVRERATARGLAPEASDRLAEAVESARRAGLPPESVADKVLEGLAKGVDPARIAAAADDLARRLALAQEALAQAGVTVEPARRRASLERMAAGIPPRDEVLALARASRGAEAAGLEAAVRQLARLRQAGVPAAEAIPALSTLAREGRASELDRVAPLLEEYLGEGGQDRKAFLEEVRSRAEQHRRLDDLVDPFGSGPDPLNRSERPAKEHEAKASPSLEKSERAGSVPGLDKQSAGRKAKDCKAKKGCE